MRLLFFLSLILFYSCTEPGKKFSLATLEEDIAAFSPEEQEKLTSFASSYDNFGFRLDSIMGVPTAEVKNSTYQEILDFMQQEKERASNSDRAYLSNLLDGAKDHQAILLEDSSYLYYLTIDREFFKANNLDLIHGRRFDPTTDTAKYTAMVSVKAAKTFGVTNPWNIKELPSPLQIIGSFETRRTPPFAKLPKMILVVVSE